MAKKLRQQDDLDNERYIVLILDKEDLENYVNKKEAESLFYNKRFREAFEENIMQDWDLSLSTTLDELTE